MGGLNQPLSRSLAPVHMQMSMMHTNMMDMSDVMMEEEEEGEYYAPAPPEASISTASVQQSGAGAATFVIPRKATIESDNKPHKLTIGVITLSPHFMQFQFIHE